VKLHGKPIKDQKEILQDIAELHSAILQDQYTSLYCTLFSKWCISYNEFVYYFEQQWNFGM
jgi:hypothetical protein